MRLPEQHPRKNRRFLAPVEKVGLAKLEEEIQRGMKELEGMLG
jgi:hypothetical protein